MLESLTHQSLVVFLCPLCESIMVYGVQPKSSGPPYQPSETLTAKTPSAIILFLVSVRNTVADVVAVKIVDPQWELMV